MKAEHASNPDSIDRVSATREASRRRRRAIFAGAAFAVAAVAASRDVSAEGKTAFLAEQLRKNTDFRVRIDAALKLGTSDDLAAVKPLCGCLGDKSEVEAVRVACAAALGKLKRPGSDECLKTHASTASPKLREQIAASLKSLGGAAPATSGELKCPGTPATGAAKYYVGIVVANKSARPDAEVKPLVERELACKLLAMARFKLAPEGETDPKKMAAAVSKEKLDGYFLNVSVEPIKYDGGALKVSLKVTIMTHTRDLKGELGKSLTMPGVSGPSKSDEDDLLKMAAEKVANEFAGLKP
jgi:hypothetical protein